MEPLSFLPAIFRVKQTEARPKTSAMSWVSRMLQERMMARIAPTQVPLVTPRISGVAKGLENSDWKVFPAQVRPAPTMMAIRIRGRRRFTTME